MHSEQENEFIVLVFGSLDLIQHRLGLLKQNQSFLETFLGDEIDGTLVQLVNDDRHLV